MAHYPRGRLDPVLIFPEPNPPADIMPGYVEFAAQQAVADLVRDKKSKLKAALLLSRYLEEADEQ